MTIEKLSSSAHIAGIGDKDRVQEGNTWRMAIIDRTSVVAVQIIWIFELPPTLLDTIGGESKYVHVRLFPLVPKEAVLGATHPCASHFDRLSMIFTRPNATAPEKVLPISMLRLQVVVVPFRTQRGDFFGLKLA
jgi:hypothetical protein